MREQQPSLHSNRHAGTLSILPLFHLSAMADVSYRNLLPEAFTFARESNPQLSFARGVSITSVVGAVDRAPPGRGI